MECTSGSRSSARPNSQIRDITHEKISDTREIIRLKSYNGPERTVQPEVLESVESASSVEALAFARVNAFPS